MPRRSRQRSKRQKPPSTQPGAFHASAHPFAGLDREKLREVLVDHAERQAEAFPRLIAELLALLRRVDPVQVLATVCCYGLQVSVSDAGIEPQGLTAVKFQQHHAELLQALILTLPPAEWGQLPAIPADIQLAFDVSVKLADAFSQRRLRKLRDHPEEERTDLMLAEQVRLHTQAVRNWGYFSDVVVISGELYAPLDAELHRLHGVTATQILQVARWLSAAAESRLNARWGQLRRVARERTIPRLVRAYYKIMPGIEGDPAEFVASIPAGSTREDVLSRLLAHADLALPSPDTFTADKVANGIEADADAVERVLRLLSFEPGDLKAQEPERFFLDNPVWPKLGIRLSDEYVFCLPHAIFSHVHDLFRSLLYDERARRKLADHRAAYLEAKTATIIRKALPAAEVRTNVAWAADGRGYETDLIAALDRVVLIVESKSAALSAAGLRGAPDRLKRHVRELVVEPSQQSERLASLLMAAAGGDAAAAAAAPEIGVEPANIQTIIRANVTLDDFSIMASSELPMRRAGWIPDGLQLAPTLNIADLQLVADILERPAHFVHYFAERARFQKAVEVFGDEIDFLGFYLSTGFNTAGLEGSDASLVITGMSETLDQYYNSRDAGV